MRSGTQDRNDHFAGVVVSAAPEATEAGVRVLEAGGNAVDAAVAVSFALAVAEPAMSGLGGQTQILLFSNERGGLVINGTSFAPRRTPRDAVQEDLTGHRAATVPTTVRVLDHAWRRFGSGKLTWKDLLAPAVEYAEKGFVIGPFRHRVLARHHADLRASETARRFFLRPDGSLPGEGERWKQPVLAATLGRIASAGAGDFYRGELAAAISEDMSRHDGWITSEDLAGTAEPVELAPLAGRYREYDVWTLPPPGGGWVVLRMLELLKALPVQELLPGDAARPSTLARILHRGHLDRFMKPVSGSRTEGSGETTHFTLVDGDGMVASVSASLNTYYGARAAHPDLGFLYNDYMNEFELGEPDHPFAIGPSATPFSSMSPTVLTREGAACLALGSPGSERIVSAVTQVVQLWVDARLSLAEAVAFPRIHAGHARQLLVEDGMRGPWIDALIPEGFQPAEPAPDLVLDHRNAFFGGVHAVALEKGGWRGAADPRRDGTVGLARG